MLLRGPKSKKQKHTCSLARTFIEQYQNDSHKGANRIRKLMFLQLSASKVDVGLLLLLIIDVNTMINTNIIIIIVSMSLLVLVVIDMYIDIYVYIHISLSLSLDVYQYIHICIYEFNLISILNGPEGRQQLRGAPPLAQRPDDLSDQILLS